jgi:hypothetical protein
VQRREAGGNQIPVVLKEKLVASEVQLGRVDLEEKEKGTNLDT